MDSKETGTIHVGNNSGKNTGKIPVKMNFPAHAQLVGDAYRLC